MRRMLRTCLLTSLGLAGLLAAGLTAQPAARPAPAAASVPVVVAVDTSRSLSPGELSAVAERLRLAMEGLPAGTPAGLLAFDDQPRWIRETGASPPEVAAALRELRPAGSFTLLNDALFVATRHLEDGGVVLLATDGRDESSATTVDDIARRSEAHSVRIVSVGVGRRIEERALRRLALITNGTYLGQIHAVDAAEIARAVEEARSGVAAERPSRQAATPSPAEPEEQVVETRPRGPTPPVRPTPESAAPGDYRLTLAVVLLSAAVVLLLVAAVILWRRSSATPDDTETLGYPHYGVEMTADSTHVEPPPPVAREELLEKEAVPPAEIREVTGDTVVFQPQEDEDFFDKTRVLVERNILHVRVPGMEQRSFELERERSFDVGRSAGSNSLGLSDPALSGQHFRIVPEGGSFYLVDLGSTNGTAINGHRVTGVRELRPGDTIRAGQTEIVFHSNAERLRP